MIIPEAYNAFSSYLSSGLQWLSNSISGSYTTFYNGAQSWLSTISNSPYGAILLPLNTAILWLLNAIYFLTQNFAFWISVLIANIDLVCYSSLGFTYLALLLIFLIKFIRSLPLQIFLIFLPFIPLIVVVFLSLTGNTTPIPSAKNDCLNFLDYWFIEYQISFYLLGLLGLFIGSQAFGILGFILKASIIGKICASLVTTVAFIPIFIWIYKMIFQRLSPADSANEVKVLIGTSLHLM